jgi:outer membrane protein assembly factor BamB
MNKIAALLVFLLFMSNTKEKVKIYEWRGTDRKGIFNESNLLKVWPAEGPKEILSIDNIGNGFVTPIFTEDRFYVTGEIDSMMNIFCFNLNGEKQWQTTLGREWLRSYPGSRSIPTIVDDLIYVGSGMGNLYCLDKENGKIKWSKDFIKDLKGTLPLHGYSEAALIDGDKVFWTPGGKEYNVIALNRFTGKLIWSNKGFGEASAYNPPKLIKHNGRNILVTFSMYHLMGFDTGNGKLLWSHEQDNYPPEKRGPGYGDTHCNTVLYEDGFIYYEAGDGNCGVKLKISDDGNSITQIWRNKGFDGYMGGIVKIDNYIYGSGTVTPDLRSINAETGILTDSLRIGTGALIAADNMLYYYTQKGELMLIGYNQGKLEKVSSFKIKKGSYQHFAHPVINKGILYQRHGKVLMAFDIRK